jgi:hypothetical protein
MSERRFVIIVVAGSVALLVLVCGVLFFVVRHKRAGRAVPVAEAPAPTAPRPAETRPTTTRSAIPRRRTARLPRVETPHQPGRMVDSVTIEDRRGTGVSALLPFDIRTHPNDVRVGIGDNEIRDGKFVRGRFHGPLTSEPGGLKAGSQRVKSFQLPANQRVIMVQLRGRSSAPQSELLRPIFDAARPIKQFSVFDDHNRRYLPAGYFALVERNGVPYVEVAYYPEPTERRAMMVWESLQPREVAESTDIGLIYLVEPGPGRLERFCSQGNRFREQILRIDIPPEMPEGQ